MNFISLLFIPEHVSLSVWGVMQTCTCTRQRFLTETSRWETAEVLIYSRETSQVILSALIIIPSSGASSSLHGLCIFSRLCCDHLFIPYPSVVWSVLLLFATLWVTAVGVPPRWTWTNLSNPTTIPGEVSFSNLLCGWVTGKATEKEGSDLKFLFAPSQHGLCKQPWLSGHVLWSVSNPAITSSAAYSDSLSASGVGQTGWLRGLGVASACYFADLSLFLASSLLSSAELLASWGLAI